MSYILIFLIGIFNGFIWSYSTVYPKDLEKISVQCVNNGGLEKVDMDFSAIRIYCKDGAKFTDTH